MIRTAVKFGAFVVVCLFFTGYLAFTIGNLNVRDPLGRDTYQLTASFDDVSGLLPDDNVKVAGVVVGKVTSVKVHDGRAVVGMSIKNAHDDIPREGTSAAVRWRNLIGQRYIYLYPGKPGGVALQDGDRIRTTTSVVDLGELFNKLGPIVTAIDPDQVNALLETLTQALDGREDKVGAALDDLATLARGLSSRDEAIQRLVTNLNTVAGTIDARDAEIDAMLDNLTHLADAFNDDTATLDAALSQVSEFGTNLHEVLQTGSAQLDRLLANLASVTDTVKAKLPELNTFLAGFADTSRAVFRAGNRGEMLNQKILCLFTGPPSSSAAGCPTGDPIKGLSSTRTGAQLDPGPSTTGAAAIASLLEKAVGTP
jgi:phospholipid/cholesterol/gamma-HCH transport system substrate-binding protein